MKTLHYLPRPVRPKTWDHYSGFLSPLQENEDFDFITYDDNGRIDVNSIEDFYKDSSVAALLADDTGIADHAMCITGLFEPFTRKLVFRLSDQI